MEEEQACAIVSQCSGAPAGVAEARPVLARMGPAQRERALAEVPGLGALLCTVFPYYNGRGPGNISLYARGRDYHLVARERLEEACRRLTLRYPGFQFRAYADVSPYPEVYACARAGLGLLGQNGLLLTPRWGSYVFCGLIATDLPLAGGGEPRGCCNCGMCRGACPGGALEPGGRVAEGRCLSALTQQRGELTEEARGLIARGGMAWGCDACQTACPHNRGAARTFLAEFCNDTMDRLTEEDLEGFSDRAFRRRFAGRAFTWRGIAPLRRNLALLRQGKKE